MDLSESEAGETPGEESRRMVTRMLGEMQEDTDSEINICKQSDS